MCREGLDSGAENRPSLSTTSWLGGFGVCLWRLADRGSVFGSGTFAQSFGIAVKGFATYTVLFRLRGASWTGTQVGCRIRLAAPAFVLRSARAWPADELSRLPTRCPGKPGPAKRSGH